jgi:hypothetical protein
MLRNRLFIMKDSCAIFESVLNDKKMQLAKILVSCVGGILFFGTGYYAGQSVALFVASLFLPAVTAAFWPVLLFSVVVGLATFTLFWHISRVSLKKFISSCFGLDEDHIHQLSNRSLWARDEAKLLQLQQKIDDTIKMVACPDTKIASITSGNELELQNTLDERNSNFTMGCQ